MGVQNKSIGGVLGVQKRVYIGRVLGVLNKGIGTSSCDKKS